jgi:hypothetical protein
MPSDSIPTSVESDYECRDFTDRESNTNKEILSQTDVLNTIINWNFLYGPSFRRTHPYFFDSRFQTEQ